MPMARVGPQTIATSCQPVGYPIPGAIFVRRLAARRPRPLHVGADEPLRTRRREVAPEVDEELSVDRGRHEREVVDGRLRPAVEVHRKT